MKFFSNSTAHLVVCFLIFLVPGVIAQTRLRPVDHGPPELAWWVNPTYEKDTAATAVILFDIGQNIADPFSGVKFTHHRRIKIYKQSALKEWANITIVTGESRITDFKCTIYNYENGVINSTKIQKDAVYKEKVRGIKSNSIAIPNAKVGSVIDYSYTIKIPYYTIFKWNFQHSIPVLWSEYEIFFPEEVECMHELMDCLP